MAVNHASLRLVAGHRQHPAITKHTWKGSGTLGPLLSALPTPSRLPEDWRGLLCTLFRAGRGSDPRAQELSGAGGWVE